MAETQLLARLSHRLGHAARALPLPGSRPGTKKRVDTLTRPGRHEVRRAEGRGPGTRRGGTRRSRIRRGAAAPPRSRVARRQAAKVRRTRAALAGTALLSALILVGWFPAASLLHQRAAISASAAELTRLQREDAALTQEQQALGSPAEIARLARERYQLVNPGEQAFEVLPPAGKSGLASYSGDPGNQPVVSPSSASELPPVRVRRPRAGAPPPPTRPRPRRRRALRRTAPPAPPAAPGAPGAPARPPPPPTTARADHRVSWAGSARPSSSGVEPPAARAARRSVGRGPRRGGRAARAPARRELHGGRARARPGGPR